MKNDDKGLVCMEFYGDSLMEDLLGAIDVRRNSMDRAMKDFGRALCRYRGLNAVEVRALDGLGREIDRTTVYR